MKPSILAAVVLVLAVPSSARGQAFVVNVARSGGDFASPIDALLSITDASADRPYLVKVHPGVYDLGAYTLVGKPYVDIEGAGEGVTVIKNTGTRIFELASNEEVRRLTFLDGGSGVGGEFVVALGAGRMRFVTIDARARAMGTYGLKIFLDVAHTPDPDNALVQFEHLTIKVPVNGSAAVSYLRGKAVLDHCSLDGGSGNGSGVTLAASTSYPSNITINETSASGGYYGLSNYGNPSSCSNDRVLITRSSLKGEWSVAGPTGCRMLVLDSILDGPAGADVKCVGSVNPALDPVVCQ